MYSDQRAKPAGGTFYLFAVSFLSLFLELLLIRWVSTEIRIFAYFRNLVLIACFLGLGVGFNLKRVRLGLLWPIALVTVLAAIIHPSFEIFGVSFRRIPTYLVFPDYFMWYSGGTTILRVVLGIGLTSVLFLLLGLVFIPFGQVLGAIFENSDNRLRDYCVNLAGSLAGTWAFTALSYYETPPWIWLVLGAGGAAVAIRPRSRRTIVGLALVPLLLVLSNQPDTANERVYWSPYQKLTLRPESAQPRGAARPVPFLSLDINTVLYMTLLDLSPKQMERFPDVYNPKSAPYYPYDLPFRFKPHPARVLIMGAGAGNDAAAALRNGAGEVDAVEIDPVIARIGRQFHPEAPYRDPRVRLTVDDARSFMRRARAGYDLIVFALLDSHTLTSNFTNINLDSYLYTRESFTAARQLMAPDGVMAVSFDVARPWLGAKLYQIAADVFGEPPVIIRNRTRTPLHGLGGTLFLCGDTKNIRAALASDPELARLVAPRLMDPSEFSRPGEAVIVPTDDWPYLYLEGRRAPTLHLIMMLLILAALLPGFRLALPGANILRQSHFLLLGAGFMLVEVHSITKIALLFGSTWVVNTVIISAILVMALGSNLIALRFRIERAWPWYAGLLLALLLNFLVPVNQLIVGGYLLRGIIAGGFYSLPIFFAGVIFASSIRRVAGVQMAFAANMFGAAAGGMLEAVSYVSGMRAVVLVAIALYLASALALRVMPTTGGTAPDPSPQGRE